jgi:hypothetical protein
VFGIFTSRAMKERGRYQIQAMKTRNSTGNGQKIELDYNIDTMRITDSGEEEQSSYKKPSATIMENIKSGSIVKSTSTPRPEVAKIEATVDSTRLKAMLAGIKQNN